MNYKEEINRRKNRWFEFLTPESSPGIMFTVTYPEVITPLDFSIFRPGRVKERIEFGIRAYEKRLKKVYTIKDDSIPYIHPFTGTEIFAEAFGCTVHYPDVNMPFALPLIHSEDEVSRLKVPEVFSTPLSELFEITDNLQCRCGKDVPVKLPDIQSPMDIAALIWEKTDFMQALLLAPEAVVELTEKIYDLLTSFLDEWFKRYGTEYVAHCPDYLMRKGITLSEDEAGSVSPETFRKFFHPHLTRLSERYGGLGIHCCANARHQWENFKSLPDLRLLNLCQPNEVLLESLDYFSEKCVQMPGGLELRGAPECWIGQLPEKARCVLTVNAQNTQDAIDKASKLEDMRSSLST